MQFAALFVLDLISHGGDKHDALSRFRHTIQPHSIWEGPVHPHRIAAALLALVASAFAITSTTTTLSVTSGGTPVGGISTPTTVKLIATVSASGSAVSPGQVKFCDNSINAYCTGNAYLGLAQLTSTGKATLPLRFGYGTHSLQAIFLGTNTYSGSQSTPAAFSQHWKPGASFYHISAEAGDAPNTYNVYVNILGLQAAAAPATPSGSVSFIDTTANTVVASGVLTPKPPLLYLNMRWQQSLYVGKLPLDFALGDFNGDGNPDLAILNSADSSVEVLLGNGDGTFTAGATVALPSVPADQAQHIVAGDFNGDGNLDLIVSAGASGLFELLGNGDGTFHAPTTISGLGQPTQMAVGDFNHDGIADLVVLDLSADPNETVWLLQGNGDGTFHSSAIFQSSSVFLTALSVGALSSDGNLDLILGNTNNENIALSGTAELLIFSGNGDGTFQAPKTISFSTPSNITLTQNPAVNSIALADLNNDGKLDIVAEIPQFSGVEIAIGNGDGTFQTSQFSFEGAGYDVATGDFNFDGNADLVITDPVGGSMEVLFGKGDGTFTYSGVTQTLTFDPQAVVVGDFNGDGKPDIAVLQSGPTPAVHPGVLDVFVNFWSADSIVSVNNVAIPGSGSHNIKAYFPGDANYRQANSATIPLDATGP